jgi:ribonucleoside-diphosphate reductase alpha chain
LLGSINLTRFVRAPFTDAASFDWDSYGEVVRIFTRMLDNVVEINGLPLPRQREEILRKRRHGMGFLGLGSAMVMLGYRYGNAASRAFTDKVSKVLALEGWRQALELAKEKGAAPILTEVFEVDAAMLRKRPEMAADGYKVGDKIAGRVLHARYSRYMQRIAGEEPELVKQLEAIGARFTHHSSIAPTGTIALSLANNASNGIEPSFAHSYSRNVIREGRKTKERIKVMSYELLAYRALIDPDADVAGEGKASSLPEAFIDASEIEPEAHIDVQAAAQQWVDSSISKTVNVPTDIDFDRFKELYLHAAAKGLKGCTTFRYNPEVFSGVLVRDDEARKTKYRFVLDDGSEVVCSGDEQVEYDGELHTAANLYDALKDGYYGRIG